MTKADIDQFLNEKHVGVVGVSRTPSKLGNSIYKKLKKPGRALYPIHSSMEFFDGDKCFPDIEQLPAEVSALLVSAKPESCLQTLKKLSYRNIKRVWIFTGPGDKTGIDEELDMLSGSGINVIYGYCPLMFLEPVTSVHSFHRFFVRLFGKYPK